jgi:cytochrome c oxidase assembly protein subunit 15
LIVRSALAIAAIALTAVVVATSAFLRHVQSGAGCTPWPDCYARMATAQRGAPASPAVQAARVGHRIAATGVGIVVVGLVLLGWMRAGTPSSQKRLAWLALALVVGLASLGVATEGARMPAVAIGNLVGGHALLAVLVVLAAIGRTGDALSPRARTLALAALVAALAQPLLGGAIDAQHALPACAALSDCAPATWADFLSGASWNPFRLPEATGGRYAVPAGAAWLHAIHLGGALAFVALALAAAAAMRHARPRCAAVLASVAALQVPLGILATGANATIASAVAHSVLAAIAIAAPAAALAVDARSSAAARR